MHHDFADPAQIQPLGGKVIDQRIGGARVGEHPPHFPLQHGRRGQPTLLGKIEQPLVRNAAPQEKRQTRRDFQVAQTIWLRRRARRRGIAVHPQKEVWIDEHSLHRELDARVKRAAVSPSTVEKLEQRLQVCLGNRTAIGEPREA